MGLYNTIRYILGHPLNSTDKAGALRRFVAWQVGSRLVPGPVVVNFVDDAKLVINPGDSGATGNLYAGLHEFGEMAFLLHLLRREDFFVDVGANIGAYTILASAVVGATCLAFEPGPLAFSKLQRNIRINGVGGLVDARQSVVGATSGEVLITTGLDTVNHVLQSDERQEESVTVPATTLDVAIATSHATLIKIDVEGFETNVIAGASRVLVEPSLLALIVETNGSGEAYGSGDATLHAKITGHGFRPFTYEPKSRRLEALTGHNPNGNTLYIRNIEEVETRLSAAGRFNIAGRAEL